MEGRIAELLSPIAAEVGVDVLKISLGGGHHQQLLKVVVDATGGVPFEMLERISRALSLQLDAEDMIPGRYRLEVTSPGLDWPLASEADFLRHKGERLKAVFAEDEPLEGENLGPTDVSDEGAEGPGVRLRLDDGCERVVAVDAAARIVRVVDWKRASSRKQRKNR